MSLRCANKSGNRFFHSSISHSPNLSLRYPFTPCALYSRLAPHLFANPSADYLYREQLVNQGQEGAIPLKSSTLRLRLFVYVWKARSCFAIVWFDVSTPKQVLYSLLPLANEQYRPSRQLALDNCVTHTDVMDCIWCAICVKLSFNLHQIAQLKTVRSKQGYFRRSSSLFAIAFLSFFIPFSFLFYFVNLKPLSRCL